MGDLTKRLSRWEFACKCGCGFDTVDIELVQALEKCADFFDTKRDNCVVKIYITSGNRCESHNRSASVAGAANSQHIHARAADFKLKRVLPGSEEYIDADAVADYLELKYPNKYGVGRYQGRTHVDIRAKAARWGKRINERQTP